MSCSCKECRVSRVAAEMEESDPELVLDVAVVKAVATRWERKASSAVAEAMDAEDFAVKSESLGRHDLATAFGAAALLQVNRAIVYQANADKWRARLVVGIS